MQGLQPLRALRAWLEGSPGCCLGCAAGDCGTGGVAGAGAAT